MIPCGLVVDGVGETTNLMTEQNVDECIWKSQITPQSFFIDYFLQQTGNVTLSAASGARDPPLMHPPPSGWARSTDIAGTCRQ